MFTNFYRKAKLDQFHKFLYKLEKNKNNHSELFSHF